MKDNRKRKFIIILMFNNADQVPTWARAYIATATDLGLVKGKGNGEFDPNGSITRAEAVTLILTMLNNLK